MSFGFLAAAAVPAAADDTPRETVATILIGGGALAPLSQLDGTDPGTDPAAAPAPMNWVAIPRLALSWEHPRLEPPQPAGVSARGSLIPELSAGAILSSGDFGDHRDYFVGAGARLELDLAQHARNVENNIDITIRAGFYLGGRVSLLADRDHTPFYEGVAGVNLWIHGRRYLIQDDIGVIDRKAGGDMTAVLSFGFTL